MKDMEDILELIDEDYGTVSEEKKPRQIKTRAVSFGRIANAWRKFRISRNEKKLAKAKEKALTDSYNIKTVSQLDKAEKKVLKKAKVIAKLESKIKVLSKEDVPTDYVEDRAIKLKDNMMKNLRFNGNNAYSVGLDKEDEIFKDDSVMESREAVADSPVEEAVNSENSSFDENASRIMEEDSARMAEEVQEAMREQEERTASEQTEEEIEVVPTSKEAQEIKESVEDGFEAAEKSEGQELSKEEIDEAINSMINALGDSSSDIIGHDNIEEVINDAMDGVTEQAESMPNVISPEEVESVVGKGSEEEFDIVQSAPLTAEDIEAEIDGAMENIRVPRSGNAARIERYDENGEFVGNQEEVEEQQDYEEEAKYEYKPMTAEEIARARENIGEYDPKVNADAMNMTINYEEIYGNNMRRDEEQAADERNDDIGVSLNIPSVSFKDVFKPVEKNDSVIELPQVNVGVEEENTDYYDSSNVERELPMVVPERQLPDLYYSNDYEETAGVENSENQDLHFDYSNTTARDIDSALEKVTSLNDFEELKRRAIALQQQQEYTRMQVEAAEREAEEAERQAEEAKRIAEESAKAYQAKMEKLRIYTEALEEDCRFNVNRAKLAENNTQCNRRFVETQISKVNDNEALMNEIDSIIAPEAINVRRR